MTEPTQDAEPLGVADSAPVKDTPLTIRRGSIRGSALSWDGIRVTVPAEGGEKDKVILDTRGGAALPGRLLAIMGPSGAGKSTMLDVLAGRNQTAEGLISLGGHTDATTRREQVAYVTQEDALFPTQTAREAFAFACALRLPHLDEAQQAARVDDVIQTLGLEKCANTLIGNPARRILGLSGGEKRRTSIGIELVSGPKVLFLDEPTSGLDAHAAHRVVNVLRSLASNGATVVCTIHQPSSEVFRLFDDVIFLAEGKVQYQGPVSGVVAHFNKAGHAVPPETNPADHALFVLDGEGKKKACEDLMALVGDGGATDVVVEKGSDEPLQLRQQAPIMTQIYWLIRREALMYPRDVGGLIARFGSALFTSIIVGCCFTNSGREWGVDGDEQDIAKRIQNHFGAILLIFVNSMFAQAQPMLLAFPTERPVFLREYATGMYSVEAYVLCKSILEIPFALITSILIWAPPYWLIGFNGNFAILIAVTLLFAITTSSYALALGSATRDISTALNLFPLVLVPQILFSGAFVSTDSLPPFMRWAQYLCSLKYASNLGLIAEFGETGYVPDDRKYLFVESNDDSLWAKFDVQESLAWLYAGILMGMYTVLRGLTCVLLATRSKG